MRWWPIAVVILLLALIPFAFGRSRGKPEPLPPAPREEAMPSQTVQQRLNSETPSVSPFFFVEVGPEPAAEVDAGKPAPTVDMGEQKDVVPETAVAESNRRALQRANWRAKWTALRAIRGALDSCHNEERIQSPWLHGELKIEMTVAPRLDANLGVIDELVMTFEKRYVPKFVYCVETALRVAVIAKPAVRIPLSYDYTLAPREDKEATEEEEDAEGEAAPDEQEGQVAADNS